MAIVLAVLFGDFGIGAKTTTGFGRIGNDLAHGECVALLAGRESVAAADLPAKGPDLPRYLEALGVLLARFRNADGSFNERAVAEGKQEKQLLEKVRAWWAREGEGIWRQRNAPREAEPAPPAAPSARQVKRVPQELKSLAKLEADIGKIVEALRKGQQP
jgi:hypothetical protein